MKTMIETSEQQVSSNALQELPAVPQFDLYSSSVDHSC